MRNRYPGVCHICGGQVKAGAGDLQKSGDKWLTSHLNCITDRPVGDHPVDGAEIPPARQRAERWITVTSGMRGHFAVLVERINGIVDPVMSGIGSYANREGAIAEGKDWAATEGLEFRE